MLSVSTAWNYKPLSRMRPVLEEIYSWGIKSVELGYKLTDIQLEETLQVLSELKMSVSSVHNFCPLPSDGLSPRHPSNYYRLSALDDEERRRAVVWTKRAVDTAARARAKVVVIHAGTIELEHDPTEILRAYKSGQTDASVFGHLRDQMLRDRQTQQKPYLEAVIKSLKEVVAYSKPQGILIGLETRYYPTEIPNFEELGVILNLFSKEEMGFWHDIGHGEVNVRLGIVSSHQEYYQKYGSRLIGLHIHGVDGIKDHQAPFKGDFDFSWMIPFWPASAIKVIESHGATADEMKQGISKILNELSLSC